MEFLSDPNVWIAFAMLTALEIVLGIDNIIFISILVGRLPPHLRDQARRLGLGFAMVSRLLLLFTLGWVMGLTADLFSLLVIPVVFTYLDDMGLWAGRMFRRLTARR